MSSHDVTHHGDTSARSRDSLNDKKERSVIVSGAAHGAVAAHTSSFIAPNLLIAACMSLFAPFQLRRADGSAGCDEERASLEMTAAGIAMPYYAVRCMQTSALCIVRLITETATSTSFESVCDSGRRTCRLSR